MGRLESLLHKTALFTAAAVALAISPLEKIVSRAEAQTIVPEVEWTMPLYTAPAEGEYPVVYDVDKDGVDDVLFANGNLLVIDKETGNVKKTIDVGEAVYQPTPYTDKASGDVKVLVRGVGLRTVNPKTGKIDVIESGTTYSQIIRQTDNTTLLLFNKAHNSRNAIAGVDLNTGYNIFEPVIINSLANQGITTAEIDGQIYIGATVGNNADASSFYIFNQNGELTPGGLQQVNPLNTPPSSANGHFLFGTWGPLGTETESGVLYSFSKNLDIWNITSASPPIPLIKPANVIPVVPVQADNDAELETIVVTAGYNSNHDLTETSIHILNDDGSYTIPPIPIGKPVNNISVIGDYMIIPTREVVGTDIQGALEVRNLKTGELAAAPFLYSPKSEIFSPAAIYKTTDNQVGLLFSVETRDAGVGYQLLALKLSGLPFDSGAQLWQPDGNFHRNREFGYVVPGTAQPQILSLTGEFLGDGILSVNYSTQAGLMNLFIDPDNTFGNQNEIPILGAQDLPAGENIRLFQVPAEGDYYIVGTMGDKTLYTAQKVYMMPATFGKLFTPIEEGVTVLNPEPGTIFNVTNRSSNADLVQLFFKTAAQEYKLAEFTGEGDTRQLAWDVGKFAADNNIKGALQGQLVARVTESTDNSVVREAYGPGKLTIQVGPAIPGDFDYNNEVNFDDFFKFVDHFGLETGDTGFDTIYDLDSSGAINFDDFFRFVDNFGRTSTAAKLVGSQKAKEALYELAKKYIGLTDEKIAQYEGTTPSAFRLAQNFPNPFNAATTIGYSLPAEGNVSLDIYSLSGQRVYHHEEFQQKGSHSVNVDAKGLSSGVYIYRLHTDAQAETRRMLVLR